MESEVKEVEAVESGDGSDLGFLLRQGKRPEKIKENKVIDDVEVEAADGVVVMADISVKVDVEVEVGVEDDIVVEVHVIVGEVEVDV